MSKLEKDILKLLREDARYSAGKIAVMLGEDENKVAQIIADMEKKGIIVKYSAFINADLAEDTVQALIEVKVVPQKSHGFDAIAQDIYNMEEVKSLYLMSGAYDLAVFVEGKSLKDVAMFVSERLSAMDTVLSTATHFILKKYKIEGTVVGARERTSRLAVQP